MNACEILLGPSRRSCPVTWHGMAECVVDAMVGCGALRERVEVAKQSLADSIGMPVERPRHSAMANARLSGLLGCEPRGWRSALVDYVCSRCG